MKKLLLSCMLLLMLWSCQEAKSTQQIEDTIQPLITEMYTADPSAHLFDGSIYIYPSHDYEAGIPEDDFGNHFAMRDYHVFKMNEKMEAEDMGRALDVDEVPWAHKQMWAPDAAYKDGTYYFYFPAKDSLGIFRIGVATASTPEGPFTAQPKPMVGSFSIDPTVFEDTDGTFYMYFGGIWGGQLQNWESGEFVLEDIYPADDQPAINPKMARLSDDMPSFDEPIKEIVILDEKGSPLTTGDLDRRFFEAAWIHQYNDTYYFSYSTGDTHNIVYATGDNPYGPFTYQGVILKPVLGWTNHHSIIEKDGKWYLFFHDSSLSGGKTHLRSVKFMELKYNEDGTIQTLDALVEIAPEE